MSKFLRLMIAGLLSAALPAPLLQAQDEGEEDAAVEYPLEILDISLIVEPLEDFPGPRTELSPGRAIREILRDPGGPEFMEEKSPKLLSEDELEDMLRKTDPVWEEGREGVSLKVSRRKLYLQGPAQAVARARRLLSALEKEASRSWCLRAVVIEAPGPQAAGEPLGPPPAVMTSKDAEKALAAAKAAGWKVLGDSSVCALNGQRVNLVNGRERSFIVDVDVEVAQDSSAADPIVEVLRDGLVFDVKPLSSPSGASVRLEFFLAFLKFEKDVPLDTGNRALGEIDMPRISGFRLSSAVVIPSGSSLLLGPMVPSSSLVENQGAEVLPGKKGEAQGGAPEREPKRVYVLLTATEVK